MFEMKRNKSLSAIAKLNNKSIKSKPKCIKRAENHENFAIYMCICLFSTYMIKSMNTFLFAYCVNHPSLHNNI